VSVWEIIIKKNLGKLEAPNNIEEVIDTNGFIHLPITIAHTIEVGNLPSYHDDPFDRLLIAQAIYEDLTFVTGDEKIQKYPIKIIKA
ncbi:MAG: PIN domain-containing protein, partial [Sphingobacteriaceae bacterium]